MKKTLFIGGTILIAIIAVLVSLKIRNDAEKKHQREVAEQQKIAIKNKIADIKKHYNLYVKTNKETNLYILKDNKYIKSGKINKDVELFLDEVKKIDENTKYFKIKDLDYYLPYSDVETIEEIKIDDRYKRYVVFNENIVTNGKTTFYNDKGYVYELEESFDLPIIIKDTDKYYVEYNNNLYYVKKDDVTTKSSQNTSEKTRDKVRALTYHAVFKEGEKCKNASICHPYSQFDSHMKYLSENNYLTLKMEELEMFLDKKINIPMKTIVITLDDGNLAQNAVEILDKYKLYATYFLITGRHPSYTIPTEYVDYESHTDNLHNNYKCPGGQQGGQLLCEDKDKIVADLKSSQEKLGGSKYFSYPFFDWNERAINILKECGFHLAFIGQWTSNGYNDSSTNRFMLRRKTIFATDSLEKFKSYLA